MLCKKGLLFAMLIHLLIGENVEGVLRLVVYGHAKNANGHDPIEKKPVWYYCSDALIN